MVLKRNKFWVESAHKEVRGWGDACLPLHAPCARLHQTQIATTQQHRNTTQVLERLLADPIVAAARTNSLGLPGDGLVRSKALRERAAHSLAAATAAAVKVRRCCLAHSCVRVAGRCRWGCLTHSAHACCLAG